MPDQIPLSETSPKVIPLTEKDNVSDAEMIALSALVLAQATEINAFNELRKMQGAAPYYSNYIDTGASYRLERALKFRGVI
jgi:hypothetical protein